MSERVLMEALIYVHVVSLSLWFGGLFGYVVIVWPAIMSGANGKLPRALLAGIAMRTAPWIYVAMAAALLTFAAALLMDGVGVQRSWMAAYGLLLIVLAGNNVYGTVTAWPRIMLLPFKSAGREWFWFRVRMSVSLVIGLALHSVAVITTLSHR